MSKIITRTIYSNDDSPMLKQSIHEIIRNVLPDLFDIHRCEDGYRYYFKDRSITHNGFKISDILLMEYDNSSNREGVVDVELVQSISPLNVYDKIELELTFDNPNYYNPREDHGLLQSNKNLNLSEETCTALYQMGIDIKYYSSDDKDFIGYDRQRIMRKHTIENIINT